MSMIPRLNHAVTAELELRRVAQELVQINATIRNAAPRLRLTAWWPETNGRRQELLLRRDNLLRLVAVVPSRP